LDALHLGIVADFRRADGGLKIGAGRAVLRDVIHRPERVKLGKLFLVPCEQFDQLVGEVAADPDIDIFIGHGLTFPNRLLIIAGIAAINAREAAPQTRTSFAFGVA
jgi:hypothetical protein